MDWTGFDFLVRDVVARGQRREPHRQPTFTQAPQFLIHRPGAAVFGIRPGSRDKYRVGPFREVFPYPPGSEQEFRFVSISMIFPIGARDRFLNVRVLRDFVVQFRARHNRFVGIQKRELRAELLAACFRVRPPLPVPIICGLIAAAQTARVNKNQERLWVGVFHSSFGSGNGMLAGMLRFASGLLGFQPFSAASAHISPLCRPASLIPALTRKLRQLSRSVLSSSNLWNLTVLRWSSHNSTSPPSARYFCFSCSQKRSFSTCSTCSS